MWTRLLVVTLIVGGVNTVKPEVLDKLYSSEKPLPNLRFAEVLNVVSAGVQIEMKETLRRDPGMKAIYEDATRIFEEIVEKRMIDPELVFGKLQNDLGDHQGREYAAFFQSFWDIIELYESFYRLNADLHDSGMHTPFIAFLGAIHKGLNNEVSGKVFIAGDGGNVNPLGLLRERELVFINW